MFNTDEYLLLKNKVPHVAEKIAIFWGTKYFLEYVQNIMFDTRDGKRNGFPGDVAKAIHALQKQHEEQFKFPEKVSKDPWDNGTYRW